MLTGATGFLGSAILARLLESGHDVVAVVRNTSKFDRISHLLECPRLVKVNNTPDCLSEAFATHKIDTVIHTATEYGRGDRAISNILDSNLILPIRIAELGAQNQLRNFINTDSYFNKPGGSYSNLLNYSLSKRTLLTWLEKFSTKINISNLVLEHLYGPNDSRSKFVEDMVRKIAIERKPYVDLTYGHQKRDFIYISDVVEAFITVLNHSSRQSSPFKNFEVGLGHSMQVRDFVLEISRLSQSPSLLNFGAKEYRDDEMMNSKADIRELTNLGWHPKISPKEGIKHILDSYQSK